MPSRRLSMLLAVSIAACATESGPRPQDLYRETEAVTLLEAPAPDAIGQSAGLRDKVSHGKYLVELLGCGACHTDGALIGAPDPARGLAGSGIGIAYANPLGDDRPGITFPANITPDIETGIGDLSDTQIGAAIRAGRTRHGQDGSVVMPWPGYARLTDEDLGAIIAYLRSIEPVKHRVPRPVAPGTATRAPYVYFGVYQRR